MLSIALTKGRLEKQALDLFDRCGWSTEEIRDKGRRLILPLGDDKEVMLAKAPDVLTYVTHGVCDVGIVGRDTIMEYGGSFYEVLDLGFGRCRFVLAIPEQSAFYGSDEGRRIASKYPNVTRRYFACKGMDVDIIQIQGSVELAPLLGIADGIVDIVETGSTLNENGLKAIEDVAQLSARLIVNTVSMKLKKDEIESFLKRLESEVHR